MKSVTALKRTPLTQQEIECRYFEMFRRKYSLPPGAVIYGDKPDVVLNATRTIGIEIRSFYLIEGTQPESEQVQRKRREAAVATGQQLYRQSVGRNVELTFSFDKTHPIQNVGTLATGLAALARRVENWDNGEISRDVFEDIPELDFAYLYSRHLQHSDEPDPKFPNGQPDPSEGFAAYAEYRNRREARARQEGIYKPLLSPARWKVAQLHKFGLMSTKRLTEIVQEKEVKARQYAKCDAYWLLIVVDFIDSAQEQEIRVDDLSIESDVFEKIIVYKPYFDQIVDVRVQPRRAASGA